MSCIFNGTQSALHLLEIIRPSIEDLFVTYKISPFLAIIRVGHNSSSALYVKNKLKTFSSLGLKAQEYWLPEDASQEHILTLIDQLNHNTSLHGIIIQLPLPSHLNAQEICSSIHPSKDVDGLTPLNQGLLFQGKLTGLIPCTPLGCLFILKAHLSTLSGKKALILGRSLLVGKPMALLLVNENATVTLAHSKSCDLSLLIQEADILVSAMGNPLSVKAEWIKEGAIVLDVGITKAKTSSHFLGDIDFKKAAPKTSFITPVPGGIGPMTVACLVYNTLKAAKSSLTREPVSYDFSILKGFIPLVQ